MANRFLTVMLAVLLGGLVLATGARDAQAGKPCKHSGYCPAGTCADDGSAHACNVKNCRKQNCR